MKFKAVLFDMDGVLTDSFESCFRGFNFALEHFKKRAISREEYIKNCWGTPVNTDLEMYLGKDARISFASEFYHTNYTRFIEHTTIFPGVVEILNYLKEGGFKTAVVTNTHRKLTLKILEKFNLINYFDAVFGGDDVSEGKPAPEIVLKACEELGVLPKDAVMVGDTDSDMKAGRIAGCFTIGAGVKGDVKVVNLIELKKYLS